MKTVVLFILLSSLMACSTTLSLSDKTQKIEAAHLEAQCAYDTHPKAVGWVFLSCQVTNHADHKQRVAFEPETETQATESELQALRLQLGEGRSRAEVSAQPVGGGVGMVFQIVSSLGMSALAKVGTPTDFSKHADLRSGETKTFHFPLKNVSETSKLPRVMRFVFASPIARTIPIRIHPQS